MQAIGEEAAPVPTAIAALPAVMAAAPARKTAMSGLRKAAILIVALGEDLAKRLFQSLPEPDVERLTAEIAGLRNISPQMSTAVVQEFHDLLETQQFVMHGGLDYATKLLVDSFGKQRADDLLAQVKRAQEANHGNLAMLEKVDPQQLGKFLDGEHPQTIALVLAHLDTKRAAQVLENLSEEQQVNAVRRLAEMRQFSPEMAQKVAVILHRRLEKVGDPVRTSYSGFKAVADLLNRLEGENSKKILERVEQNEPGLAVNIRNLMFTFEDLLTVPAASVREIVAGIDKRQLALALRGAPDPLRAHIFKAMSSRAVEMLQEDMEVMGPVRTKEVTAAQHEMLTLARRLEAEGKIVLKLEQGDGLVF